MQEENNNSAAAAAAPSSEDQQTKSSEAPAPVPQESSAVEEEKKQGEEESKEESKTVTEIAPDANLSEIFVNLDEGVPSDIIPSMCMECKSQGETRFMYTKIPMFKEIILSSFNCEECGIRNNEVQFGGKLGDLGCKYKLAVTDEDGLNRSVVKSEFATIRIPELDFEIPPQTQKGSIKTVEGFLLSTIEGISEMQEERRKFNPQVAEQLDQFIERLKALREGRDFPFNFEVIDPSGNSFVQNPNAPNPDVCCIHETFNRTIEDYQAMGYNVDEAARFADEDRLKREAEQQAQEETKNSQGKTKATKTTAEEQEALLAKMQAINEKTRQKAFAMRQAAGHGDGEEEAEINANMIDFSKPIDDAANQHEEGDVRKELMTFPQPCPACFNPGLVKMCCATIPFFKEIIIMAFSCDVCGHKSTEIKQGGGISEKASKITFHVQKPEDVNRDVFKSDTCVITIPEIELTLQPGTLGSLYTTVEGMLQKIIDQLTETNPFTGDSTDSTLFRAFIDKIKVLTEGNTPFTFILDDPLSNCFIYNPNAPEDDPQIQVEVYERTEEQEEELGIADMRV